MRRPQQEIREPAELRALLEGARWCRLAMVDGDRPYLVPITFALDGPDLVLHSAPVGRKVELLRRNPAVCFEVEEGLAVEPGPTACDFTIRFRTVIGEGTAEFVEDLAERARLLALWSARFGAPTELSPQEVARTCVIRIRVARLSGKRSP
jgi:hypothetical protein